MTRRSLAAAAFQARPRLRISKHELIAVRATARTVWLFVRLTANNGARGLGEASDAFGIKAITKQDAQRLESELASFFTLIEGRSPFDIEPFRQAAWPRIEREGLVAATAFSELEQALWDLAAQSAGVPLHDLLGGAVRRELPAYANINRSVKDRVPAGFAAAARLAVAQGFRALKLAPFDNFPTGNSDRHVDNGIACVEAVRAAVGNGVQVMIDCHSFFSVDLAVKVAQRLEPVQLAWYEEPVPPEKTAETLAIKGRIRQPMAGGEILFGLRGFQNLIEQKAVDVIMPDVKHCGGLLEFTRIAAHAAAHGVAVSPHNPSGPVATLASMHVCAGAANFRILEQQVGEVPWRAELLDPPEPLRDGKFQLPAGPGLGARLNESAARRHPV